MEGDSNIPVIVKVVGIFMIFIGLTGTVGGIYLISQVGGLQDSGFFARDASKTVLDESLLIKRDKDGITNSLGAAKLDVNEASKGLDETAAELSKASNSLKESSSKIDGAADSISASGKADKEAAGELKAAADAMDILWGPTNVAINLREAAAKIEESGGKMESASMDLKEASKKTLDASSKVEESSKKLVKVGSDLNRTGSRIENVSASVDSFTQRFLTNLNELIEGLQWLEGVDKKTIIYEVILYFMLIHLTFLGTGVALVLMSANLYGW